MLCTNRNPDQILKILSVNVLAMREIKIENVGTFYSSSWPIGAFPNECLRDALKMTTREFMIRSFATQKTTLTYLSYTGIILFSIAQLLVSR